jgi:hypothetical protein
MTMTDNNGGTTRRTRLRAAVAGVAAGALTLGLVPAAGAQPYRETIRDEFEETIENFCGREGLTVDLDGLVEIRLMVNARKRDRLPYVMEHQRVTVVYTSDGGTVTEQQTVLVKDLRVTDNGDTFTVLAMGTGNATVFDEDGKAIARNPGQTRFELLLDDEFQFLENLGVVFGSTGRNDDFCAAVVPVLAG